MSELTPNEIADFPLRTAVRGYKVEQVDDLLDRVADRIEVLERELEASREAVRAAERRAEESTATETTLKRTLVTAQRAAEETVAQARTEAETIVSEAQQEADRLVAEARAQAEEVRVAATAEAETVRSETLRARRDAEDSLTRLHGLADRFRVQLHEHLDEHASLLDRIPAPAPQEFGRLPAGTGGPAVEPSGRTLNEPEAEPGPWSPGSALFAANRSETQDFDDPEDSSP